MLTYLLTYNLQCKCFTDFARFNELKCLKFYDILKFVDTAVVVVKVDLQQGADDDELCATEDNNQACVVACSDKS